MRDVQVSHKCVTNWVSVGLGPWEVPAGLSLPDLALAGVWHREQFLPCHGAAAGGVTACSGSTLELLAGKLRVTSGSVSARASI